jgi:group II intron reverse transcriptase/maturase
MTGASMPDPMLTKLREVAVRAKRDPHHRFFSLAHLIDVAALERAYLRIRNDASVGVDGVTKLDYGQKLLENLQRLHERLKAGKYRHQHIRRVHIPKGDGKTRPIGVSCLEDKIVQEALREVLEVVYEQDFMNCSYGFRRRRSAHDAIRAFDKVVYRGEVKWVLEADIKSFFDSLDRTRLMEMLQQRIADGTMLRLVGKCLNVGVLDGAEFSTPVEGTTQGSVLSPLLGNVYLHHVLDLWFERDVRPRLRGKAHLIRYADDFVIGLERLDDAERVYDVLPKRMGRFNLTLHPDKTRLIPFERPSTGQTGKGPGTFDFLGFTLYWRRTRRGRWQMFCMTRRARLRKAIQTVSDWCRDHRHWSVADQHAALTRRIQGHMNYFGVNGNMRSLAILVLKAERAWHKWLCRRSQRSRLNWERFKDLLQVYPLPKPRIMVQIWGGAMP